MKKHLLIITFALVTSILQGQIVNIPDANFKAALLTHNPIINLNSDNEIQLSEAVSFGKTMIIDRRQIVSLEGIEAFVNLAGLICTTNQITSINVTKNTALTTLYCSGNKISNLDLSKNKSLINLDVNSNQLTSLDLSNNPVLKSLIAFSNLLTTLDVSLNGNLKEISCNGNQISILNFGDNSVLEYLDCSANKLKTLNVNKNSALKRLVCNSNNLNSLDVSSVNSLGTLLCYNNPDLPIICINSIQLTFTNSTNYIKDATGQWSTTCGTITGIEDLSINSTKNRLIRILNPLGQELQPEQATYGLFIYQYSDGSTKKLFKLE